jgi:hypothetical protein
MNKIKIKTSYIKDNNLPVLIILLTYLSVKLFYINTMLRWDGAYFYCLLIQSINNFDFTLNNFFNYFNWNGHPSMGYALIMSLGQFIDLGNHTILNIQNLLLALLAIFSFYKILVYLYQDNNRTEILLMTSLFAFNPLFFGVSLTLSLDFPLIIFWTAAIYALLYNRMIFFTLFGTLLVFSKETGAFLYFVFLISIFFVNLFYRHEQIFEKKIKGLLLYLIIPAVVFACYLVYSGGQLWKGGSLNWSSNSFHAFGFNLSVLTTRLSELFILNFNWILTLIILISLINIFFSPINYLKYQNESRNNIYRLLFLVFIAYIIFNLFYITWNHPRYVILSVFFLLIFSHYALLNIFKKERTRILILACMLVLSLIQTFKTVDPLSKKVFNTLSIGEHQMLSIGSADELVYNAEYVVIDTLLNKLNKEININDNSNIILSDVNDGGWMAHFNGAYPHTTIYINKSNLTRTFKKENAFQPKTYTVWEINQDHKPVNAYYIEMWYGNGPDELKHLQQYYSITEIRKIDHHGYYFKLYKLEQLHGDS